MPVASAMSGAHRHPLILASNVHAVAIDIACCGFEVKSFLLTFCFGRTHVQMQSCMYDIYPQSDKVCLSTHVLVIHIVECLICVVCV